MVYAAFSEEIDDIVAFRLQTISFLPIRPAAHSGRIMVVGPDVTSKWRLDYNISIKKLETRWTT